MYTLRHWWDRHGLQIILGGLALGAAWLVRQTQGAALFEIYKSVIRPFDFDPPQQEWMVNARMKELQERLVELENQNQKLKELTGYISTNKKDEIVAPIVGRSSDHWWQQIIIGRGTKDGIQVGFVVSGVGGLVGRIVAVTENTSKVLLISDPTSRVGVTISRSRYMGFMRGQAENLAVMEFFDKDPDVRRGDVVSTSSFSQLFPPGLPVGHIESVNLNKSPAPEAIIELSAPINNLEWVIVTPTKPISEKNFFPPQSPPKTNPFLPTPEHEEGEPSQ